MAPVSDPAGEPLAKPGHRGMRRAINATVYSARGLAAAFRHEEAFRLEVVACLLLAPLAVWLGQGPVERVLLLGSLLLVLIVELLNSAVEAAVDRIGPEHHPLSGRAKDIASAAVFVALLNVLMVWGLVLGGRLLD